MCLGAKSYFEPLRDILQAFRNGFLRGRTGNAIDLESAFNAASPFRRAGASPQLPRG